MTGSTGTMGATGTTGFTGRGGRKLLVFVSLGDTMRGDNGPGVARPDDIRADTAARGLGGGEKNDDPPKSASLLRIVAECDDTNGAELVYCGGLVIEKGLVGREL